MSSTKGSHSVNGSRTRPKVLVPEKLSPDGLTLLRQSLEVDERKGLSPDELLDIISDYDALIVRSETKVTASLLQAGRKLKVVARAGVGVDNVDVEAATKLGIIVVNSPSGNIGAAAEHTIALLLAVARNVADGCSSLKAGKWERSRLVGVEVMGKTLGIIGLGKGTCFDPCFHERILANMHSRPQGCKMRHRIGHACGGIGSLCLSSSSFGALRRPRILLTRTPPSLGFSYYTHSFDRKHKRNDQRKGAPEHEERSQDTERRTRWHDR